MRGLVSANRESDVVYRRRRRDRGKRGKAESFFCGGFSKQLVEIIPFLMLNRLEDIGDPNPLPSDA